MGVQIIETYDVESQDYILDTSTTTAYENLLIVLVISIWMFQLSWWAQNARKENILSRNITPTYMLQERLREVVLEEQKTKRLKAEKAKQEEIRQSFSHSAKSKKEEEDFSSEAGEEREIYFKMDDDKVFEDFNNDHTEGSPSQDIQRTLTYRNIIRRSILIPNVAKDTKRNRTLMRVVLKHAAKMGCVSVVTILPIWKNEKGGGFAGKRDIDKEREDGERRAEGGREEASLERGDSVHLEHSSPDSLFKASKKKEGDAVCVPSPEKLPVLSLGKRDIDKEREDGERRAEGGREEASLERGDSVHLEHSSPDSLFKASKKKEGDAVCVPSPEKLPVLSLGSEEVDGSSATELVPVELHDGGEEKEGDEDPKLDSPSESNGKKKEKKKAIVVITDTANAIVVPVKKFFTNLFSSHHSCDLSYNMVITMTDHFSVERVKTLIDDSQAYIIMLYAFILGDVFPSLLTIPTMKDCPSDYDIEWKNVNNSVTSVSSIFSTIGSVLLCFLVMCLCFVVICVFVCLNALNDDIFNGYAHACLNVIIALCVSAVLLFSLRAFRKIMFEKMLSSISRATNRSIFILFQTTGLIVSLAGCFMLMNIIVSHINFVDLNPTRAALCTIKVLQDGTIALVVVESFFRVVDKRARYVKMMKEREAMQQKEQREETDPLLHDEKDDDMSTTTSCHSSSMDSSLQSKPRLLPSAAPETIAADIFSVLLPLSMGLLVPSTWIYVAIFGLFSITTEVHDHIMMEGISQDEEQDPVTGDRPNAWSTPEFASIFSVIAPLCSLSAAIFALIPLAMYHINDSGGVWGNASLLVGATLLITSTSAESNWILGVSRNALAFATFGISDLIYIWIKKFFGGVVGSFSGRREEEEAVDLEGFDENEIKSCCSRMFSCCCSSRDGLDGEHSDHQSSVPHGYDKLDKSSRNRLSTATGSKSTVRIHEDDENVMKRMFSTPGSEPLCMTLQEALKWSVEKRPKGDDILE
ncbi:hypothetical protein ADUPG1_007091 [Aduncisulcus paluster]|uniref:Uncharacterized protein n=1 Tax=Aduncisulcus paluster TaxID=2918883 RepID=A0ABQ5KKP1_9EUKA|nr:hypothetical protein ADUPG1_007091 [Aduncisulcus paluster]